MTLLALASVQVYENIPCLIQVCQLLIKPTRFKQVILQQLLCKVCSAKAFQLLLWLENCLHHVTLLIACNRIYSRQYFSRIHFKSHISCPMRLQSMASVFLVLELLFFFQYEDYAKEVLMDIMKDTLEIIVDDSEFHSISNLMSL